MQLWDRYDDSKLKGKTGVKKTRYVNNRHNVTYVRIKKFPVSKKFQLMSLEFFSDTQSFRSHYGPGVDSASNKNEYQEHFLGVMAAGA